MAMKKAFTSRNSVFLIVSTTSDLVNLFTKLVKSPKSQSITQCTEDFNPEDLAQ